MAEHFDSSVEKQIADEIAAACPAVPITRELAPCGHYIALFDGKQVHYPPSGGLSVKCEG